VKRLPANTYQFDYGAPTRIGLHRRVEIMLGEPVECICPLPSYETLNRLYRIETRTGQRILKRYLDWRVLRDLPPAHRARTEYLTLTLCESGDLAAPKAIAVQRELVLMEEVNAGPISASRLEMNCARCIANWLADFHALAVPAEIDRNWIDPPIVQARQGLEYVASSSSPHLDVGAVRDLLLSQPPPSESRSLVRGDAMLGNWITDGRRVIGVDFELTSVGNRGVDFGVLASSILVGSNFHPSAYDLIRVMISTYNNRGARMLPSDIQQGALCGLILKSASVAQVSMKTHILSNARASFDLLGAIC
jgi:tRNA A-37 threonylcarbamoyl transferase component Bud32